ncbi:MAG: hypothetical protein SFW09_12040 [Hyphomicrobiaceae bacterium]|nr:hypothetical protein [Hyphomicrobiaceae bacterium]
MSTPISRQHRAAIASGIVVAFSVSGAAPAGADGKTYPPVRDPLVAKECGACHMKFPAGLLPAASWQRIMAGLKDHFGENAELDAATAQQVLSYLMANAEPGPKAGTSASGAAGEPLLRITEQPWFKRKHGPKRISADALKRKNARSAADCVACHGTIAETAGVFED